MQVTAVPPQLAGCRQYRDRSGQIGLFHQGKLWKISANSGHYRNRIDAFYRAVLHMSGAFNDDTTVFLYDSEDDVWVDYPIAKFINAPTGGNRYRTHSSRLPVVPSSRRAIGQASFRGTEVVWVQWLSVLPSALGFGPLPSWLTVGECEYGDAASIDADRPFGYEWVPCQEQRGWPPGGLCTTS